jgi:hypothetical protein
VQADPEERAMSFMAMSIDSPSMYENDRLRLRSGESVMTSGDKQS